jgi:hypothetical protein
MVLFFNMGDDEYLGTIDPNVNFNDVPIKSLTIILPFRHYHSIYRNILLNYKASRNDLIQKYLEKPEDPNKQQHKTEKAKGGILISNEAYSLAEDDQSLYVKTKKMNMPFYGSEHESKKWKINFDLTLEYTHMFQSFDDHVRDNIIKEFPFKRKNLKRQMFTHISGNTSSFKRSIPEPKMLTYVSNNDISIPNFSLDENRLKLLKLRHKQISNSNETPKLWFVVTYDNNDNINPSDIAKIIKSKTTIGLPYMYEQNNHMNFHEQNNMKVTHGIIVHNQIITDIVNDCTVEQLLKYFSNENIYINDTKYRHDYNRTVVHLNGRSDVVVIIKSSKLLSRTPYHILHSLSKCNNFNKLEKYLSPFVICLKKHKLVFS